MQQIYLQSKLYEELIEWAKQCGVKKIVLFGSRARGDNKERSDIDIAISGGNVAEFITGIDEQINTLLMFDVIHLDGAMQSELRDVIEKEGIVIYEKAREF